MKITESQLRQIIKTCLMESIDELNTATLRSAYTKMNQNKQFQRANNLYNNSRKIVYEAPDNTAISMTMEVILVDTPDGNNYKFNISKCQWDEHAPRFYDRRAAVVLANLIRKECGENAGQWADKNSYIA